METTIHGKLIAKRDGLYTVYVFQEDSGKYVMCTQLPNWGSYSINIGDSGYLTYEEAKCGESYVERDTGETKIYRFDNQYFKEFIKDTNNIDEVIL